MKVIFDFLTSPFELPINPIWNYIVMAIIGVIAFQLAYWIAGENGTTSGERRIIHWIVRIIIFAALWAVCCALIIACKFIAAHWIWFVVGLALILVCATIITIVKIKKRSSKKEEKVTADEKNDRQ